MGMLRQVFGPSRDEVWRQLCNEIGADFVEGGFWKGNKVQAHVKEWIVTLDTYTVSTGKSHVTYTRMRAPYVNRDGFRFTIYRRNLLSDLGKLLGMQDIDVGDPEFDRDLVIKGNDESKVLSLFGNPRICQLIQAQPSIHLQVKDDEGWFSASFPEGVDELCFHVVGVIKDIERLKSLYELFAETLGDVDRHRLCRLSLFRRQYSGNKSCCQPREKGTTDGTDEEWITPIGKETRTEVKRTMDRHRWDG